LVAKQSCNGKDLIGKAPRLHGFYQWQGVSGCRLVGCSEVFVNVHPGNSTCQQKKMLVKCTPPKFNMEPENDGFPKESPFPGTSFQVPC